MKTEKLLSISLIFGIAAILIATLTFGTLVSAQDGEEAAQTEAVQTEQVTTTEADANSEEVTTEKYMYVAQSGDSYTKMARKATQTYGIETETNLSGAQIVFIETNLTLQAGSPELVLGQEVSVEKNTVSEWVEKAKQLTESQIQSWQVYADSVDFDTNSVGQPQA